MHFLGLMLKFQSWSFMAGDIKKNTNDKTLNDEKLVDKTSAPFCNVI